MARLGLLPIEIEEGRWHGIPREERKCKLGCNTIGDMGHFLRECFALNVDRIPALDRVPIIEPLLFLAANGADA